MNRLVACDWRRYNDRLRLEDPGASSWLVGVEVLLVARGWHALVLHRISEVVYRRTPTTAVARTATTVAKALLVPPRKVVEAWSGMEIMPQAVIGAGLLVRNPGGVVIGRVRLGASCTIGDRVTLGRNAADSGRPTVGEGVVLAPGAKVFGPVTVGDDATIGPNAVVLQSVPARSTATGVPAVVRQVQDDDGALEPPRR